MFYGVVSLALSLLIHLISSAALAPVPPFRMDAVPPTPTSTPPLPRPGGCLLFAPLQRVLIAFVLQHTGETTARQWQCQMAMAMEI